MLDHEIHNTNIFNSGIELKELERTLGYLTPVDSFNFKILIQN